MNLLNSVQSALGKYTANQSSAALLFTYYLDGTDDTTLSNGSPVTFSTTPISIMGITTNYAICSGTQYNGMVITKTITIPADGFSFSFFASYNSSMPDWRRIWSFIAKSHNLASDYLCGSLVSSQNEIGLKGHDYCSFDANTVKDGVWRHYTYVFKPNGTNTWLLDFYINKVKTVSGMTLTGTIYSSYDYIYLARPESRNVADGAMAGGLYRFQFFGQPLTSTQVDELYTTPPYVPTFTISNISSSTLTATVTNVSSVYTLYTLYIGTTAYGSSTTGVIATTGLTANTAYDFYVVASNSTATTRTSAVVSETTDDTFIPVFSISNLMATTLTATVTNCLSKYTLYTLYSGTTAYGSSTTGVIAATGLTANTTYSFFVVASNSTTSTRTSTNTSVTTDPNLTATPVITLTGRTATSLSFSVSTTDSYSSMIYKIYYGTGVYISSTTTTATITGLSPSSKYDIYAVVTKDSSSSPSSNILSAVQTYFYAAPIQTADAVYAATSTGTTTAADTLVVSGATFTHANGTFVFSGSSCCSNTWLANRVFNNAANETNLWTCSSIGGINLYGLVYTQNAYAAGNYVGGGASTRTQTTVVSGTSYGGEWLQVQLPYSFIAKQLEIYNRSPATGGNAIRYPKTVIWAGSTDGSTWNLISSPTYDGTQMNTVTTVPSNTTAYNYFRVIINSNYNGGIINFYSIRYYGCLP